MRGWMLTVVVAIGLAGTARAARAEPADPIAATGQDQPTLVLHVINYAAVSSDVLNRAMARVASVYELIGVRTVWVDSEATSGQHHDRHLHLAVMLLSRDMARMKSSAGGVKGGVLGQAHLTSGRAYIFCDRIATTLGAPTSLSVPLGDVIAHEVGHLVLRVNGHSLYGIMRANMDVYAIRLQTFDKTQARTIQTRLMELTAGVNGR